MKTRISIALAMLAGFAIGAATIEGLHAQTKAPVYTIVEVDVTNAEAYAKEYAPKAQALVKKHGARLLAASSKVTSLEGAPPKRIAVLQWESMEKVNAWYKSAEFKDNRKIGNKYAKFRIFAVEGVPQP